MKSPTEKEIQSRLLDVLRRHVKKPLRAAIGVNARFQADLDMDSLNILVVVLEVEKDLNLSIGWDTASVNEIGTVADLVKFLSRTSQALA